MTEQITDTLIGIALITASVFLILDKSASLIQLVLALAVGTMGVITIILAAAYED